jgi:hypothetical protein
MATIITSRNYDKKVFNIIKDIIPECKNIHIRAGCGLRLQVPINPQFNLKKAKINY